MVPNANPLVLIMIPKLVKLSEERNRGIHGKGIDPNTSYMKLKALKLLVQPIEFLSGDELLEHNHYIILHHFILDILLFLVMFLLLSKTTYHVNSG